MFTFTALKKKQVARETKAAATWSELVEQIADGNEPSEASVLKIIAETGRGLEDLEGAVALVQQRREWKQAATNLEGLRASEADVQREMEAARRAFAKQRAAFNESQRQRQDRLNEIEREQAAAERFVTRLNETAAERHPDLIGQIADIGQELRKLHERRRDIREALDPDYSGPAGNLRKCQADRKRHNPMSAFGQRNPHVAAELQSRIDHWQRLVEAKQAELADLDEEIRKLTEQRQELERQCLQP